jgi:hypothetical protein
MKKRLAVSAVVLLATACSSTPKYASQSEIQPDRVISRIDNMNDRPEYISESEPFRISNGVVYSTGMTTLPADHRVEAGQRIAANNAKAAIAGAIESRLSFVFQNGEEGTSVDSSQVRHIGAEASELVTNSIRPYKNYWEKVATTEDSGQRTTKYKIFSVVQMPEADFKQAIFAAVKKAQGKGEVSKDFQDRLNSHWDKFSGYAPKEKTEDRQPSSKDE